MYKERFQFLHIPINTCDCRFIFLIDILEDVKWYLTVVLICTSLMTNDFKLHVPTDHLYIFGTMCVKIFSPFLYWILLTVELLRVLPILKQDNYIARY